MAAFGTALALYVIIYDTRRLEARVQSLERSAERAEADIAAARAELSHLSRPERIEPMARALGLAPPTRQQFVAADRLPRKVRPQP
jgi:cell division protein FtsL